MSQSLKVRLGDGPRGRREAILVMEDSQGSVQRMLVWVSNLAIDQKDLLVHLLQKDWALAITIQFPGFVQGRSC